MKKTSFSQIAQSTLGTTFDEQFGDIKLISDGLGTSIEPITERIIYERFINQASGKTLWKKTIVGYTGDNKAVYVRVDKLVEVRNRSEEFPFEAELTLGPGINLSPMENGVIEE